MFSRNWGVALAVGSAELILLGGGLFLLVRSRGSMRLTESPAPFAILPSLALETSLTSILPSLVAVLALVLFYRMWSLGRRNSVIFRVLQAVGSLLGEWGVQLYLLYLAGIFSFVVGCLRLDALEIPLLDAGIYQQIFWSLNHLGSAHSSFLETRDFLHEHFSPSLLVLASLFGWMRESTHALVAAQSLCVWGGAMGWIVLAHRLDNLRPLQERRTFRGLGPRHPLAAATTVVALCSLSLWGNLRGGFHETSMGFLGLSWAYVLLLWPRLVDEETAHPWRRALASGVRGSALLLCLALSAGSRETVLPQVAFLMLVWGVRLGLQPRKIHWLLRLTRVVGVLSLAGLIAAYSLTNALLDASQLQRYGHLVEDFWANPLHPLEAWVSVGSRLGTEPMILFWMAILGPLAGLPLLRWIVPMVFWKRLNADLRWLACLPWSAMGGFALIALAFGSSAVLRDPNQQFVLGIWPALMVSTLLVLTMVGSRTLVWSWVALNLVLLANNPPAAWCDLRSLRKAAEATLPLREKMAQIPTNASLSADDAAGPGVANRQWISRWPDTHLLPNECPQYVLVRGVAKNTLGEIGLKNLVSRCQRGTLEPVRNADLAILRPQWSLDAWSCYRLRNELDPVPEHVPVSKLGKRERK